MQSWDSNQQPLVREFKVILKYSSLQENYSPCTSNKLLNGKARIIFGEVSDSTKKNNIFQTKMCFLMDRKDVKEISGTFKDNFAEVFLEQQQIFINVLKPDELLTF